DRYACGVESQIPGVHRRRTPNDGHVAGASVDVRGELVVEHVVLASMPPTADAVVGLLERYVDFANVSTWAVPGRRGFQHQALVVSARQHERAVADQRD